MFENADESFEISILKYFEWQPMQGPASYLTQHRRVTALGLVTAQKHPLCDSFRPSQCLQTSSTELCISFRPNCSLFLTYPTLWTCPQSAESYVHELAKTKLQGFLNLKDELFCIATFSFEVVPSCDIDQQKLFCSSGLHILACSVSATRADQ